MFKKIPLIFFFLLFSTVTPYVVQGSETEIAQRVHAHLLLKDPSSALKEALEGLNVYPQSKPLYESLIVVYANQGSEKEMMAAWEKYAALFPEASSNTYLLETMAWGILQQGSLSSTPMIRALAMMGSFLTNDSKGVEILKKGITDSNSLVRAIAVQLAANLHDRKLSDQILMLFPTERVWSVKMEMVEAIGKMKIEAAKPFLQEIVANSHAMAEEKAMAIQALIEMTEKASRSEIEHLAKSNRAGLRLMACELIISLNLTRDIDLVIQLLNDSSSDVRAAALQTLGILRPQKDSGFPIAELALNKVNDPQYETAISAAWLLTLYHPLEGQKAFLKWLRHESREVRILAAAALAATGKYGFPLTKQAFSETSDLYVRMNLALGLITQRIDLLKACDALYDGLINSKERWMLTENSFFKSLAPSTVKHREGIPQYPEAVNQLVRLEFLNTLSILKYPKAQEAIKDFLKKKTWGISGTAAAVLLTEGDEEALELVKPLLGSPDPSIRSQAALILALWGRDEIAIQTLQDIYPSAYRELKERILEGIGKIGAPSAIPFLIERLKEPAQSLRMIAAFALLECLNH